MYLIRRASAQVAAAKNNGTSDLWRSHSGVVRRRLFLLYATPGRRAQRHSSIINPPQRQCELFVSRNVSPAERNCFPAGDGGWEVDGKWKAIGAPDGVIGVDRWPIYRRGYRVNRSALSNTTNSIRTQQQQPATAAAAQAYYHSREQLAMNY